MGGEEGEHSERYINIKVSPSSTREIFVPGSVLNTT